jgi:hypothetical protein
MPIKGTLGATRIFFEIDKIDELHLTEDVVTTLSKLLCGREHITSSYCRSGKLSRQPRSASLLHHRKSYAFARIHNRDEVVLQRILRTLYKIVCPSKRPYKKERLPNYLECTNKPLRVSSCFIAFLVLPVGRPLAIRSTRS